MSTKGSTVLTKFLLRDEYTTLDRKLQKALKMFGVTEEGSGRVLPYPIVSGDMRDYT